MHDIYKTIYIYIFKININYEQLYILASLLHVPSHKEIMQKKNCCKILPTKKIKVIEKSVCRWCNNDETKHVLSFGICTDIIVLYVYDPM